MEQAGFSVTAIEKYCNIRAKLCVKNWQAGKDKTKQLSQLDKVIADLKQLLNMSPTAERFSLLGGAYKRKAMIAANMPDKVKALMLSADYYKKAWSMPGYMYRIYALTNWLEIEKILQLVKNKPGLKSIIKKYKFATAVMAKAEIAAALKVDVNQNVDMDFWLKTDPANILLCAWLLEGKNTKDISDVIIEEAYAKVWRIEGSQNKKIAETDHFNFLLAMYAGLVKKPATAKSIKRIKDNLEAIIK